jgi:hypothetical protein
MKARNAYAIMPVVEANTTDVTYVNNETEVEAIETQPISNPILNVRGRGARGRPRGGTRGMGRGSATEVALNQPLENLIISNRGPGNRGRGGENRAFEPETNVNLTEVATRGRGRGTRGRTRRGQ